MKHVIIYCLILIGLGAAVLLGVCGFACYAMAGELPQQQMAVPVVAETIDSWYAWAHDKLSTVPGLFAVLMGYLFAFIIPQRLKMDFSIGLDAETRRRKTRWLSFWCGFIVTLLCWPLSWEWDRLTGMATYGVVLCGFLAAALVGASMPFVYTAVMNQLYKRGWANEQRWSGEARANAKLQQAGLYAGTSEPNVSPPQG